MNREFDRRVTEILRESSKSPLWWHWLVAFIIVVFCYELSHSGLYYGFFASVTAAVIIRWVALHNGWIKKEDGLDGWGFPAYAVIFGGLLYGIIMLSQGGFGPGNKPLRKAILDAAIEKCTPERTHKVMMTECVRGVILTAELPPRDDSYRNFGP